jgi:transposase
VSERQRLTRSRATRTWTSCSAPIRSRSAVSGRRRRHNAVKSALGRHAGIGPIDRFRSDAQLARHSGVAPLEASSGRVRRHRLDRGGNRQLNAAFYRIAITQARIHPAARGYLERKQAEGKSRREAIRCLKRQLARVVFNTLKASPALT